MAKRFPTFKPYNQHQIMMLPPSLDELIVKDHPVRVVNAVIDSINIDPLLSSYQSIGCSSYHPQMLLKVLIYGYVTNVYSSRKLEVACKENINFMWLSAMNYPDHNTINRFRGVRLKEALRTIFEQVVKLLVKEGLISIEELYTDGTKIEANANKYTFVWKKSIQTNKEKMKKQLAEIWTYAQTVADKEDSLPDPPDFTTINAEKVKETVEKLNSVLTKNKQASNKAKAKMRYISKNFVEQIKKYEHQEDILGERNSYSKTDPQATFMMMKEDHMQNGQLKPGYNVQISTSNQYIVNYTIHSNPTDTRTLKSHLEQFEKSYGINPTSITADAGYGSEENYDLLQQRNIKPFVKYNMFDTQQHQATSDKTPFSVEKLFYQKEHDSYVCPMGQDMRYIGSIIKRTSTGYEQRIKRYQAQCCSNCPLNGKCHKSKGNRTIEVNENLNRHRFKAFTLLNSEEGKEKRKKRCFDVEPVFGNIKNNHKFKRFMLRGKEKVEIEWGLLAIAQNIRKKSA